MSMRNIAIIAHVDHGKTTLVDQMLAQSGIYRENQEITERAMDSNDLEKERGITILAKCTSVVWNDMRINIVDTPGHADFGGEVERILGMVDGVVLLVDAAEGPMPQTKFVTTKALNLGLKPIVVINKVDRPDGAPDETLDKVFDLFINSGANDDQLDFPTLYASGRNGWASLSLDEESRQDLAPLFETIIKHVEPPKQLSEKESDFKLLTRVIESDPFLGRILTGRIESGTLKTGMNVKALSRDGQMIEKTRVTKILGFRGLERIPIDEAHAGDIVAIAGFKEATVADTLCDEGVSEPLAAQPIDPPTISVTFGINDSPFSGREGDKVQSRVIWNRLQKEVEGNVALKVAQSADKDSFQVSGRGELQLGVLIETMRREGFELSVSRPRVLFQDDENGNKQEPIEEVIIDVDDEFTGVVIEKLSLRKGEVQDMQPSGGGKTRITLHCPARGLIGYLGEFLTDTRGTGILNRLFHSYQPYKGDIEGRRQGVLISMADGTATAYALADLEPRGKLFIPSSTDVYMGMIIGEHSRDNDLDVNPLKSKKLTNVRAAGKDDAIKLAPPIQMTLETAISYIDDDELVEVTPKSVRLRKKVLNPSMRKASKRMAS
ncbi:MAG: translational GTPase TypA [Pseudomonadota bacterium]